MDMTMMNRLIGILLLMAVSIPLCVFGQETSSEGCKISLGNPVYSQYIHNGLMINPAYAGARDALSITTSLRKQWIGIDGAPSLQNVSLHSPLKNEHIALGLKAGFMQFGVTKETRVHAVYAYRIKFPKSTLSFGISGGMDMSNTDYRKITGITIPDQVFSNDVEPYIMPNVGAGIYFYSKKIFAGVTMPSFLSYRSMGSGKIDRYHSFNEYNFIVTAGCLVSISSGLKFKPSTLVEYSLNNHLDKLDVNGNLIIADILWIGGSYRITEEVVSGNVQFSITPQMTVGLSYDYPVGRMNTYSKGSAEIVLRYEFGSKVSASNPRYF